MSDGIPSIDPKEGTGRAPDDELEVILETLEKFNTSLGDLWQSHKELEGAVDKALARMEAHTPSGPLHWGTLPSEAAADLLVRVADFVDFLQEVYLLPGSDFKLKRCWWQHPDVLWQVTALYAAFIDAYNPSEPPSQKQAAFHEHMLWPILHRIKSLNSQKPCSTTEHVAPGAAKTDRDPELAKHIEELRSAPEPDDDDANGLSANADDPA